LGWVVNVLTLHPGSYEQGVTTDTGLLAKLPDEIVVHRTRAIYPLQWLERAKGKSRQPSSDPKKEATVKEPQPVELSANGHHRGPSFLQRVKDAVTLPLMTPDRTIGWIPFAYRKGKQVLAREAIDVVYSSGPPWSNHLVALRLKRKSKRPWVADFRDPWVGSNYRPQRRGDNWVGRKHRQLERQVVEHADCLILNTEQARDDMRSRHADLPVEKFIVIPNGYDPADYECVKSTWAQKSTLAGEVSANGAPKRRLVIAHAGSFYGQRNVKSFIEALGNVCHNGAIPRNDICVQLIGARRAGRCTEDEQVERAGLKDVVQVSPSVPHSQCLEQLAAADILLLVQTEAPLCIPGKLFEYIALGRPILTLSGPGATVDLIHREQLGLCVDPDDVHGIEAALIDLHRRFTCNDSHPGPSADTRERYDGRRLTGQLSDVLRSVLKSQAWCPN
jgi:glycosyltransferase involved in cell wall biosynthesis